MKLTDHAQKLLDAIASKPDRWLNRAEVARMVGKNRLTPYDMALLDMMATNGYIDHRETARPGAISFRHEYLFRSPESKGEDHTR